MSTESLHRLRGRAIIYNNVANARPVFADKREPPELRGGEKANGYSSGSYLLEWDELRLLFLGFPSIIWLMVSVDLWQQSVLR